MNTRSILVVCPRCTRDTTTRRPSESQRTELLELSFPRRNQEQALLAAAHDYQRARKTLEKRTGKNAGKRPSGAILKDSNAYNGHCSGTDLRCSLSRLEKLRDLVIIGALSSAVAALGTPTAQGSSAH